MCIDFNVAYTRVKLGRDILRKSHKDRSQAHTLREKKLLLFCDLAKLKNS